MKRSWKRLASLLLAVVMACSLLPMSALAAKAPIPERAAQEVAESPALDQASAQLAEVPVEPGLAADLMAALPDPPSIPGFTQITSLDEIDPMGQYIIVTRITDGSIYALYPSATGTSVGCGTLSATENNGACGVKLTIDNDSVTATSLAGINSGAETPSTYALETIFFRFSGSGGSYKIISNAVPSLKRYALLSSGNMFVASTSASTLTVEPRDSGKTGDFLIHLGTSRYLDFNAAADSGSRFHGNYATDFWAPGKASDCRFPIYIYQRNGTAASIPGYNRVDGVTELKALATAGNDEKFLIVSPDSNGNYYALYAADTTGVNPGALKWSSGPYNSPLTITGSTVTPKDGLTMADVEFSIQPSGDKFIIKRSNQDYYLYPNARATFFTSTSNGAGIVASATYTNAVLISGSSDRILDFNCATDPAYGYPSHMTDFWAQGSPLFPVYIFVKGEEAPVTYGSAISQMFPDRGDSRHDSTWAFAGGRAVQGPYADVAGVRNFVGQFEEYIRYTKSPAQGGGHNVMQRFTINTAAAGQTLADVVSEAGWKRVSDLDPRAAVYMVGPEDMTASEVPDAFTTGLQSFVTKALALYAGGGFAVIMKPYTNAANADAYSTAIDNALKAMPLTEAQRSHIVVVDSVTLVGAEINAEGFPTAAGHTALAKALALATYGSVDGFPTVSSASAHINSTITTIDHGAADAGNYFWKEKFHVPDGQTIQRTAAQQALYDKLYTVTSGAAAKKDDQITWLFMGDSITHGAAWTFGYDSVSQLFEKFVKEDLGRTGDIVINTAISGSKASDLTANLEERLTKYKADVVSIMIGTNDSNANVTKDAYKASLATLISEARTANPDAIIILRSPTPAYSSGYAAHLDEYAAAMAELAEAHPDFVIFVDQYTEMLPFVIRSGKTVITSLYGCLYRNTGDIHPSAIGHLWMTHMLINAIGLWDHEPEICKLAYDFGVTQLDYTQDPGASFDAAEKAAAAALIESATDYSPTNRTVTVELSDLDSTGQTILAAQIISGENVVLWDRLSASTKATLQLPEDTTTANITVRVMKDDNSSDTAFSMVTYPTVSVDFSADKELTIPGYTQVASLAGNATDDGEYIIVAPYNDKYYVLYPGMTGSAGDADNVRILKLNSDNEAVGWTNKSGADQAFQPEKAVNQIFFTETSSDGYGNKYAITATAADGSTYYLFNSNSPVYSKPGTAPATPADGSTVFISSPASKQFSLRNGASNHAYLIYYPKHGNYNQNSSIDDTQFIGKFLLFKKDPVEITLENAIPGYTLLTKAAYNAAPWNGALSEAKYYMLVTQDSSGNFYALYATDVGKTIGAGALPSAGPRAAALTTDGRTLTATYLATGADITDLDALRFSVEQDGGKYLFTSNGIGLSLENNIFADLPVALSLSARDDSDCAFDIQNLDANRMLNFNCQGDAASGGFTSNHTDFWAPRPGDGHHFPIYIYVQDNQSAPTARDKLSEFVEIVRDAGLDESTYTRATWTTLTTALADAEAKLADLGSTPDQLKSALAALRDAYTGLQEAPQVPSTPTSIVYQLADSVTSGGTYAIYHPVKTRILYHADSNAATDQVLGSVADNKLSLAGGFSADTQTWVIQQVSGGYTIQSCSGGLYLNINGASNSKAPVSATPQTLTLTRVAANTYNISRTVNGTTYYLGHKNDDNQHVVIAQSDITSAIIDFQLFLKTEVPGDIVPDWTTLVPASGTTTDRPFPSGTGGSANFRIPSLITLSHQTGDNASKNGRLVAAIDARWNHLGDACSLDTILSVSDDNGKNWKYSFPNYFGDSTNAMASYGTAFIDPVMTEAENGDIYLMVDLFPGGVAINTAPMTSAAATGYVTIDGVKRLALYTTGTVSAQSDTNFSYYVGDFDTDSAATTHYAPVMEYVPNGLDVESGFYVDDHYYLYQEKTSGVQAPATDRVYCQQLGGTQWVQQNVFFYNACLHVRGTSYLWIIKSTDGGDTWSAPMMVNDQVRTGADIFYGVGPGAGLSFVSGGDNVIVLPTYTFRNQIAGFIYSSDGGVTWKRSDDSTTSGHWSSESCLVQIDDTTIRHFYRDGHATLFYTDHVWNGSAKTFSVNGGAGSPTLVNTQVPNTWNNQISAIRYSKQLDGKDVIVVSTAASGSATRANGKLYVFQVNSDKTMTLAATYEVTAPGVAYAYSSLSETKSGDPAKGGDIALLYEGAGCDSVFKVIPWGNIVPVVTVDDESLSYTYDGAAHTADITVSGTNTLSYSGDSGATYGLTAIPTFTDAGTHTIYYKVNGTTIAGSVDVVITPADAPAVTLTASSNTVIIPTGSEKAAVILSLYEVPAGSLVTLTCTDDNKTLINNAADTTVSVDLPAGTHHFSATVTNANYKPITDATCTVEAKTLNSSVINVTAKGYNGVYDGAEHGIELEILTEGAVAKYGAADGTYDQDASPKFSNAGSYTVYYKVTKESMTDVTGSAVVNITKATPALTVTADHANVIYGSGDPLVTLTIAGVPGSLPVNPGTSAERLDVMTSNTSVQNVTVGEKQANGTYTYKATPAFPDATRTYTIEVKYEPGDNANYNRIVRTCVVAVTEKDKTPAPINFSFNGAVEHPDLSDPFTATLTIPFDGKAHTPLEALTMGSNVKVTYSTDPEGEVFSSTVPSFTSPNAEGYTVLCLGSAPDYESRLLALTIIIHEGQVAPNIVVTPSVTTITGAGTVNFTVEGVPTEGSASFTCSDSSVTITRNRDGTYTASLPNTTKAYTFTMTYTAPLDDPYYLNSSGSCQVVVAAATSSVTPSTPAAEATEPTTEVTENEDGTTTTTTTDPETGAVTATTPQADGSIETVVTEKDGTVTTTTQQVNGSVDVVEEKPDGTVITTSTALNGVTVQTVDAPAADVVTTVVIPASVPEATVTIPTKLDYTTVVVNADTGEIVNLSVPTEDLTAMQVKLDASANLIVVSRPNGFVDVDRHWAEDAIDFTAAHSLFNGTSSTQFSPDMPMSRAMMVTVLARFNGVDTSVGATWYEAGAKWAAEEGISDGAGLDQDITREQLATMLWRAAGCPTTLGTLDSYPDANNVGSYARVAMRWAVQQGIIQGTDRGLLDPQGLASRAQVSTMMLRYCRYMVK